MPQGSLSKKSDISLYEARTRVSKARGEIVPADLRRYPVLRDRVREALLLGRQKIERAKVETYWQAGKYIHEHLLLNKTRAEYGKKIIPRLSADLGIHERVLYHTLQFYEDFPILTARSESFPKLSWTHYRELLSVPDKAIRRSLMERAGKANWTYRKLAEKIREEVRPASSNGNGKKPSSIPVPKLIPKLGSLYTYRLVRPESAQESEEDLQADLGFGAHFWVPLAGKRFKEGQIVTSLKNESDDYSLKASDKKANELFTYRAIIARVIDGDTLFVRIDFGFGVEQQHYLRLRGIDCPELNTPEGKRAKAFVERLIVKESGIVMTSTRNEKPGRYPINTQTDKYGRYVVDVWIPKKENADLSKKENLIYLNQVLMDEGLAERYPD